MAGESPCGESHERSSVCTYDVTKVFEDTCKALEVGEMVESTAFDLQQAMTALEIGDMKMDVGLQRTDTMTAAQRVAQGEAPLDLSEEQILVVMDRLIQLEACWHEQFMLPQTVYTCLYMVDMDRLSHAGSGPVQALHAFCNGMHTSCSFLHNTIYKGQVCYDEDVSAFTFGISLENEVSKDMLLDAIQTIDKAIQSCDLKIRQDPVSGHLEARLLFLRQVLRIWMKLMDANQISDLKETVSACKDARECLELFLRGNEEDAVLEAAVGFVATLHEAAIGCAPKKNLNVLPFNKVIEKWENILASIIDSCGWMMKARTWKDVRAGLDSFAAMDNDPFVRSMVYRIISTGGDAPWKPSISMLSKDMHLWESNSSFFAALTKLPELQHFFDQCMIAVQGWCHTKCLNRSRQRRNLRHNVADWKNMCDHAYTAETTAEVRQWLESLGFKYNPDMDSGIQPDDRLAPMTCWVVQEACWTCIDHLLLGGPLDLYQIEENIFIYWYASFLMDNIDFMARELDNISMSRQLMASGQSRLHNAIKQRTKMDGSGFDLANLQIAPSNQGPLKDAWLQRKFRVLNCMILSATANLFCALKHCGLIEPPHHVYNGYKENHEQRFGFLRQLHIPDFLEHSSLLEQEAKFLDIPINSGQVDYIEHDESKGKQAILQSFESMNTCFIFSKDLRHNMVATSPHTNHQVVHLESLSKVILANTTALRLIMTLMSDKSQDLKSRYMVKFHFVDEKSSAYRAGLPVLCFPVVSIKKRPE
eukprot:jgi/Picsp_1/296/NSC_00295-R1_n-alpha-acetyltransferase auxiliary subunit-like